MTRQLRPRKNKPSYVILAGLDIDEDGRTRAGPSSAPTTQVEDDSESDFAPKNGFQARGNDHENDYDGSEDGVVEFLAENDETPILQMPKRQSAASKGKGRARAMGAVKSTSTPGGTIPSILGPKRRMYALPAPSVHHRHRAVPLFSRPGQTERLKTLPETFSPSSTVLTQSFTVNSNVMDRVNKAWGHNVGSGPLWDLAEDRGWFKEAIVNGGGEDTEAKRRPLVYSNIGVRDGWEVMSVEDAAPYLPTADVTTEEGNLQPPPLIPCYFGPITSQTKKDTAMFETFPMSNLIHESKAHIFNAGAPVWCLDWCPIHSDDRPRRSFKQYLAVAPFPSHSHSPDIGQKVARPSYACVQIWSLSSRHRKSTSKISRASADSGQMNCEMVLCLDTGPAYELKWCPLPSHDLKADKRRPRKLGILGATFEDGAFAVFVVPEPEDIKPRLHNNSHPIFIKLPQPILRIELEETSCWTFDWANSEIVAIGTTNGNIGVYDIGPVLKAAAGPFEHTVTDILPTHYLSVHQSAIRALAWIRAPPSWPSGESRIDEDPTVIASGGYDGMECLTDIREGRGAVMNRTRDVINTLAFSHFVGGPITMDHENTVKAYSASPSMLGRGHSLFEPQGPVWSAHASEYHPQLAVGAADGSCSTTNTLRSTRRGGSVPFFVHKIFQMDYSRNTKEFRMLDRILPQESFDRPANRKGKSSATFAPSLNTGSWPQQVGVHRVAWNNGNGIAASSLLATSTASGLCRVDLLWGRWIKDKVPYGGIGGIRMEGINDADAMEEDDDEDADVDADGEDENE